MKLRPHHILDILNACGHGENFTPHPYGHALHTVAQTILSDLNREVELIIGADAICQPCRHLQADGMCNDVLHQLDPPISKQTYNDTLDRKLFEFFKLTPGTVLSIRRFFEIVHENTPEIEKICTHPGEDQQSRLTGLQQGLQNLGIQARA